MGGTSKVGNGPLVQHKLTLMRKKEASTTHLSPPAEARELIDQR
jgi:uracil phosphoribosyltransferase